MQGVGKKLLILCYCLNVIYVMYVHLIMPIAIDILVRVQSLFD